MLLSTSLLEPRQHKAIKRLTRKRHTILVAETGAGKTVICLSAVETNIARKKLKRVIVSCPAKVVAQWPKEAAKWEHLRFLKVTPVIGDERKRREILKMHGHADVLVVSTDNLDWLLREKNHGADGIIIDELSKSSGKRAASLRTKARGDMFKWRVGMTASPVSEDFQKLYAMARVIDKGKALGTDFENYRRRYFTSDYKGYNWEIKDSSAEEIMGRIRKLVHLIPNNKAAALPLLIEDHVYFTLPSKTRTRYDEMREHMIHEEAVAVNEAVKSGKLRQIASGFLYWRDPGKPNIKRVRRFSKARRNAALSWLANVGDKEPVMIFYEFEAQGTDIKNALKLPTHDEAELMELFRGGEITRMVSQIKSMSHGIDGLQEFCSHVLFYHPVWSNDDSKQARDRIWRKGQSDTVRVGTLLAEDTLDDLVIARHLDKDEWMKLFERHLRGERIR